MHKTQCQQQRISPDLLSLLPVAHNSFLQNQVWKPHCFHPSLQDIKFDVEASVSKVSDLQDVTLVLASWRRKGSISPGPHPHPHGLTYYSLCTFTQRFS